MTKEITGIREAETEEEKQKTEDAKEFRRSLWELSATNLMGTFAGVATAIGASNIVNGNMPDVAKIITGTGIGMMVLIQMLGKQTKNNLTDLREKKILQVRPAETIDEKQEVNEAVDFHKNLNSLLFNSIYTFLSAATINIGTSMIPKQMTIGSVLPNIGNIPTAVESIPIGALAIALGVVGNILAYKSAGKNAGRLQEIYDDEESKTR